MIGPYQARPYDNSRSAARLSDLAQTMGDVQADGHLRGGQIWGGAVQRVGDIANKTLSDLAEYNEQKPMREAEKQRANDYVAAGKRKAAFNDALQEAGMMPDQDDAIEFLRTKGFASEASEMAKELAETRKRALETTKLTIETANQKLTQAGTLMGAVKDAPDPASAYASALPEIRDLVGERLASALPEKYDPTFVDKALMWGTSQKDKLAMQADLLRINDQTGKSRQERDEYFTKQLGALLGTATSQEDWDLMVQGAAEYGAPSFTLEKFGKEFSPEAVAKAKALITPARADNPTTEEQFLASFAKGKGVAVGDLTSEQRLTARRQWAETGRRPLADRSGLTGLTKITAKDYQKLLRDIEDDYQSQLEPEADEEQPSVAQRGAAIRWRSATMRQLDTLARKSGLNPSSLADLGGDTKSPDFSGITASEGRTSYEGPAPSAPVRPSAPAAPSTAPRMAPAHGSSAPPPEIQAVLKDGPGEYEFSDGSIWRVEANGTAKRVK